MTLDSIRLVLGALLLLTIPIRIKEKYTDKTKPKSNKKKKNFEVVEPKISKFDLIKKITISTIFAPKNVILIIAYCCYVRAYLNYNIRSLDTKAIYSNTTDYIDFYTFALNQKYCRTLDLISFYLIGLYFTKYLQFIHRVQILMRAFKRSAFEYLALVVSITVIFIGLSILTNFVFGSYIYEYRNFLDSLIMNLKIFIFVENTSITEKFMEYYRIFSIIILILFIFLIKYFFLNLFLPVFVEYYRNEYDNMESMKLFGIKFDDDENTLTWKDSKIIFY